MFNNVAVEDKVTICFPPMHSQTEPNRMHASVVAVKKDTFVVRYLADGYRQNEFRKNDGKSIHDDDDYGWIEA
jgi:hypothetical protein